MTGTDNQTTYVIDDKQKASTNQVENINLDF